MARATRRGVGRRGVVRLGAGRVRGQRRTRPPAMGTESGWKRVVVDMETEVEARAYRGGGGVGWDSSGVRRRERPSQSRQ